MDKDEIITKLVTVERKYRAKYFTMRGWFVVACAVALTLFVVVIILTIAITARGG